MVVGSGLDMFLGGSEMGACGVALHVRHHLLWPATTTALHQHAADWLEPLSLMGSGSQFKLDFRRCLVGSGCPPFWSLGAQAVSVCILSMSFGATHVLSYQQRKSLQEQSLLGLLCHGQLPNSSCQAIFLDQFNLDLQLSNCML